MKTIKNIKEIAGEIKQNWRRLIGLSIYDLKSMNSGTFLGYFWNFLQPALNIAVYWFVFSIGLRSGGDRYGYPFIIWMISGLIPWFFISSSINQGASSITHYSGIVKRMKFPLSIVAMKPIFTNFFVHICTMTVIFLIFIIGGFGLSLTAFQLIYYAVCAIALLTALSFLFSTFSVISKDFQRTLPPIIRMLLYLSPIFWEIDGKYGRINVPVLAEILRLNPVSYIAEGYRYSLITHVPFWVHWKEAAIFWGTVIILFVIGINLHANLRKKFVDLI